MCMGMLPTCRSAPHECLVLPEEGFVPPGTGVVGGYEPPRGGSELNPSPLEVRT